MTNRKIIYCVKDCVKLASKTLKPLTDNDMINNNFLPYISANFPNTIPPKSIPTKTDEVTSAVWI